MKLYIGNCTQQVQIFAYTYAERKKIVTLTVPIGGQIMLPHDLTKLHIDEIVAQHAKYGLVDIGSIDRTRPFVGVCFSVDRAIKVDELRRALAHNREVLIARGKTIREEAAVALNDQIETTVGARLGELELSVTEENKGGRDDDVDPVSEVMTVTRNPEKLDGPRKSGNRRTRS